MTRRERVEQVRALRDRGLTFKEIAAQLGLGRSTVYAYYTDPDGERERARKLKRYGLCAGCGRKVFNSGAEPPERCLECAVEHWRTPEQRIIQAARVGAHRRWSDQQILDALRAVAVDGQVTVPMYYAAYRPGRMPSQPTIINRFGRWGNAVQAAGLRSAHVPRRFRTHRTPADVMVPVFECMRELGRPPSISEYDEWQKGRDGAWSASYVRIVVGGWGKVTRACLAELESVRELAA